MKASIIKKTKYNKETGIEITQYRITIKQRSKKAEFKEYKSRILLSNDKHYVIENDLGMLEILNKHNEKSSLNRQFNKCHVYEFKWGSRSFEDELCCNFVTTMSRKTAINKMKREMLKYCREKLYFFSEAVGLIEEIK